MGLISRIVMGTLVGIALMAGWSRMMRHRSTKRVAKVEGTPERPRMSVFRSNKHLYVPVIDDTKMQTLASASTMQKPVSEGLDFSSGPTIPGCSSKFSGSEFTEVQLVQIKGSKHLVK